MKTKSKGICIELEQDEIEIFWNIIMFAKDYHEAERKKDRICMNSAEIKLADELIEITEKLK